MLKKAYSNNIFEYKLIENDKALHRLLTQINTSTSQAIKKALTCKLSMGCSFDNPLSH